MELLKDDWLPLGYLRIVWLYIDNILYMCKIESTSEWYIVLQYDNIEA